MLNDRVIQLRMKYVRNMFEEMNTWEINFFFDISETPRAYCVGKRAEGVQTCQLAHLSPFKSLRNTFILSNHSFF